MPEEVRMDVWQFVRLMVQIEDALNAHGGIDGPAARETALGRFWSKWEDVWVDLDARLVDLGKHDMDAFADLMMEQEVVLDDTSPAEKQLIAKEMRKVVAHIKAALAGTDDPQVVEDLTFERDELIDLLHKLEQKQPVR